MIKNKIYYMLLGIGLGIIITSSMNIAFNRVEKIEYTDEQIKEKAKSLGMISIKENIENNDKEKNQKEQQKEQPKEEVKPEAKQKTEIEQQVEKTYGVVTISRDDTASSIIAKLKKSDIIKSEEEFREVVVKHSLQGKFIIGTYEIEKNLPYIEVLKKIIDSTELKKAGLM